MFVTQEQPALESQMLSSRIFSILIFILSLLFVQKKWRTSTLTISVAAGWIGIWLVTTMIFYPWTA